MNKVLVDTSVWIDFFSKGELPSAKAAAELLEAERVVMSGVVIAELLQGAKTDRQAGDLEFLLQSLPMLREAEDTWVKVGRTARLLRSSGVIVPMTDLLLAQLAIENDCLLFSRDAHFDQIPGLQRYRNK